jgi:putative transposase
VEKKEQIISLRQTFRHLSAMLFYEKLVATGVVNPEEVSYHTVYRLLRYHDLLAKDAPSSAERKRFAYDKVNTLWQGDLSVGPYLVVGGRKLKTSLFAFLDDCSRLVPSAGFSFSEKFDALKQVLKDGLLRRGIPKMIYVDNGKIYHAEQLHLACASLGITLTHTQPYDPQSKGKIERFFSTVRKRFYPLLFEKPPQTLEELNARFLRWLEEDYHRRQHSALDACPLDVFMAQAHDLRTVSDPASLDPLFFKRVFRKVNTDATISLDNRLYEVPPRYVGQKIEVRFDPAATDEIHIYENDYSVCTAHPVSFADNARVKRNRETDPPPPISFESLFSGQQRGC